MSERTKYTISALFVVGFVAFIVFCVFLTAKSNEEWEKAHNVRNFDGITILTIDGHDYIRNEISGRNGISYTYTHFASCPCHKDH